MDMAEAHGLHPIQKFTIVLEKQSFCWRKGNKYKGGTRIGEHKNREAHYDKNLPSKGTCSNTHEPKRLFRKQHSN